MANTLRKGKAKEVSKVSEGAIVDKNGKNLYVCYKCGNSSIMERFTNIVRSDLFQGMNYLLLYKLILLRQHLHNYK